MLITGFDGRNTSVSVEAVEFKCLMNLVETVLASPHLSEITAIIANNITQDGFLYTRENVISHLTHEILITRNLTSQITNKPDEQDIPLGGSHNPGSKSQLLH